MIINIVLFYFGGMLATFLNSISPSILADTKEYVGRSPLDEKTKKVVIFLGIFISCLFWIYYVPMSAFEDKKKSND